MVRMASEAYVVQFAESNGTFTPYPYITEAGVARNRDMMANRIRALMGGGR